MSGNVVAHVAMLSTVIVLPRSRVPLAPAVLPSRIVAPIGRLTFPRRPAGGRGAAVPRGWRRAVAVASGSGKRKGAALDAPPL